MPRPRNPSLNVICTNCGRAFYTTRQRLSKGKHGHFCSSKCAGQYHTQYGINHPPKKKENPANTLHLSCSQCGKEFYRKSYNTRDVYGTFCSHKCYGKWRSDHLAGEDSPQWKGDAENEFYGRRFWKQQRTLARERDRNTCQDCGATQNVCGFRMDVHHIVPHNRFDDPVEACALNNLICLCRKCHNKRDREARQAQVVQPAYSMTKL